MDLAVKEFHENYERDEYGTFDENSNAYFSCYKSIVKAKKNFSDESTIK